MSGMGPGGNLPFDVADGGTLTFERTSSSSTGGDLFEGGSGLEERRPSDLYGEQVRGLLAPIYFEFDRSSLGQTERDKALAAADHLRSNPRNRLLIEGHCDSRGTTEYNLGLGDRRATSVKDYLISIGIESDRLEILSKGDLEAIQGGSEQQMALERRAELVVMQN